MREFWIAVSLLWLAGVGLRLTILAVPPVISLIQADFQLSGTEIGVLTGLPIVLFGVVALPGSLLIARFGAVAILVAGLVIAGIASALRGAVPHTLALFAATVVMGAGIAIMQPALPPLVRQWLPKRVSFATALYTNGLLVGEALAVMLTIPIVLPLVDNSWRWAFVIWGVPLIGIFPMISLFLVTSIAMLRERTSGTLERLMTMPLRKVDLLLGYGMAFAFVAIVQATAVSRRIRTLSTS